MIPLKRLFLVAGFDGSDLEQQVAQLQSRFPDGTVRFLARPYPVRPDKQKDYLEALVRAANERIFGPGTVANFCRRQDQPCALDADPKQKARGCDRSADRPAACARARPQMIVVLCADRLFKDVFDLLGRAVLILREPGPQLPSTDDLKARIDAFEPAVAAVATAMSNRGRTVFAPLLPDRNFQRLGQHPVAQELQADPANVATILDRYHRALYRQDFVNAEKPKRRGAYMLDDRTAFQDDRLHTTTQIIGPKSRANGFHLLNAYHTYGFKVDPGFHFDVMNVDGGKIGRDLVDVLKDRSAGRAETHLNATPCDRLV
jgi:hypothetical protein